MIQRIVFCAICFVLSIILTAPVHSAPVVAFFFDARALSVDDDKDGGDDYILAQFDVDLDENITSNVTVVATLYDQSDRAVAANQITYQVTDQEEGYTGLNLIPNPNIEGIYYVHIALSDRSDELYINDIGYNPEPGSEPVAYFADAAVYSGSDYIEAALDVNIVQQIACGVSIEANLIDSAGSLIESRTFSYKTFFEDIDYKNLSIRPAGEDAYSLVLMVYPEGSGIATDSRILPVLWPPGTGAYFSKYSAKVINGYVEVIFDVDLAYNVSYKVSVEALLYNSNSDIAGYNYVSYLTSGSLKDEKSILLFPEPGSGDGYYVELIVYVDDYPASHGYISELVIRIKGDLNNDGIVKVSDAVQAYLIMTGSVIPTDQQKWAADMNGDGEIQLSDVILILRRAYGLPVPNN